MNDRVRYMIRMAHKKTADFTAFATALRFVLAGGDPSDEATVNQVLDGSKSTQSRIEHSMGMTINSLKTLEDARRFILATCQEVIRELEAA